MADPLQRGDGGEQGGWPERRWRHAGRWWRGTLGRRRARGERGAVGEGAEFRVRPLEGAWDWGLLGGGRVVGGGVRKSGSGDV
jgi:hypothetical protein